MRLLGRQFRTRARSSFLTKKAGDPSSAQPSSPNALSSPPAAVSPSPPEPLPSALVSAPVSERLQRLSDLNNKVAMPPPIMPPSPHATSSLSPSSPKHAFSFRRNASVFPNYTPYSVPQTVWDRLWGNGASVKIQKYNYMVPLQSKGGDVLSHVDDSEDEEAFQQPAASTIPAPAPFFSRQASARSHHSFASSMSSGRGGGVHDGNGDEGDAAPSSSSPPPSRASFVRRLSSAFFPSGGGMRARALTSPAFLWSYALSPSLSPSPDIPSPSAQLPPSLDSSPLSPSRRASELRRQSDVEEGQSQQHLDGDGAGEELWQESDDSLDHAPPQYLTPEEHALLQMRKHSLGQSLDSKMFQQFRSMDVSLALNFGMLRSANNSKAGSRKSSGKVLPSDQAYAVEMEGGQASKQEVLEDFP
ncbi:hypothetical protein EON64_04575 [archaeon]|nr:MAG: hypothetical protein EON64_04575 [archaeon]